MAPGMQVDHCGGLILVKCYFIEMNETRQRKPPFWPVIFVSAFLLGAILWGLWMTKFIQQTRARRSNGFFVPMSNAPPFTPTAMPGSPTNPPAAGTNAPH
jgi:hypothetical protein